MSECRSRPMRALDLNPLQEVPGIIGKIERPATSTPTPELGGRLSLTGVYADRFWSNSGPMIGRSSLRTNQSLRALHGRAGSVERTRLHGCCREGGRTDYGDFHRGWWRARR